MFLAKLSILDLYWKYCIMQNIIQVLVLNLSMVKTELNVVDTFQILESILSANVGTIFFFKFINSLASYFVLTKHDEKA